MTYVNLNDASTTAPPSSRQRAVAAWLLICCALVFAMVVLGGVTRLTGSGLSMVEWEPIVGVVPPLTEQAWEAAFSQYQQYPEFRLKNHAMGITEFKSIFWLEYLHRLLGRLIGVAFLVPFLYFLLRGRLDRALAPKLATMFLLGGLQGLLGWYMVKSGLVDNPHVSQYRLTAHLAAALVIYAYLLWVALGLLWPRKAAADPGVARLRQLATALSGLVFLTALSGGFVAGLKAGLTYNTFPLMEGHWIPPAIWALDPWWRNLFEDVTTVQFDHRLLAVASASLIAAFWLYARHLGLPTRVRVGLHLLLATAAVQVSLGISTLLLQVPVPLASAHQAGALLLFTLSLYLTQGLYSNARLRPALETTARGSV